MGLSPTIGRPLGLGFSLMFQSLLKLAVIVAHSSVPSVRVVTFPLTPWGSPLRVKTLWFIPPKLRLLSVFIYP